MKNFQFLFVLLFALNFITTSCKKTVTVVKTVTDTVAVSSKDTTFAMDVSGWDLYSHNTLSLVSSNATTYFNTSEGIKFFAQGIRKGARLQTKSEVGFKNKTIYYKWKANNGGQFVAFVLQLKYDPTTYDATVPPIQGADFSNFSFLNPVNGSFVIQNDVWYYTRIKPVSGTDNFIVTTCINNYDNKGGTPILTSLVPVYTKSGYISLRLGDNFSATAYAVLGECKIAGE